MGKRLLLLASFFILTPVYILALVFYQTSIHHKNLVVTASIDSQTIVPEKLPKPPSAIQMAEVTLDIRIAALENFLGKYKSPLTTYARKMVEEADKYGLDYRLLPAIAMQESLLCRRAPQQSYNCWGFGIYGGKVTRFDDFNIAIETVSKTLAKNYHSKGLQEPAEIMTKYTPANTNSWAENVSYVMNRIGTAL